jgi:hypothetical protein
VNRRILKKAKGAGKKKAKHTKKIKAKIQQQLSTQMKD